MANPDFTELSDQELVTAAGNESLGMSRGLAIEELASRALLDQKLLPDACTAISSDRRIGFHAGAPLGWFGADRIYLSGQERAIRHLLEEMGDWDATEQEDLVRHWAGKGGLAALSQDLERRFGFVPRYQYQATS